MASSAGSVLGAWLAWLAAGLGFYLVVGAVIMVVVVLFFANSDLNMMIRFFWCASTHQRWHVVQHERPTLTRLYCVHCGFTHLKMKRREDHGKPTNLPG